LEHAEPEESGIHWAQGLDYRAYEGRWLQSPSPLGLEPLKQGITRDFDTSLATRATDTALEFSGWLEVPREGVYTFTAASDDGCLLFVDSAPTRLEVMGDGPVPSPQRIAARQMLTDRDQHHWAEVEGRVTFASQRSGSLTLELNAGTGRMSVEVADSSGASPLLLLNSRIRVTGICHADYTPDGQLVAGSLLAPSVKQLEYIEMAPGRWSDYPVIPIARLPETTVSADSETVVHLRGKIVAQAEDGSLVLDDDSGQVRLHTAQPPPESDLLEVEALGRLCRDGTNSVLGCAFYRDRAVDLGDTNSPVSLLTTIEQVKRLTRREAQRFLPVKVRGVVTSSLTAGCFVQDGAWAIYVRWPNTIKSEFPKVGEYWEIEGTTFFEFAPNVRARGAIRLGAGVMPEPFRPSWDQLINGSLDARYVEILGIVTSVELDGLGLLTRDGRITVQLSELPAQTLKLYENALIRLRGCLIPAKDDRAHKVELGRISLSNCSVAVDEPAPADPFALPLKRLGELLLFDPRASSIQRVKLSGQVLHERHGEYFLLESGAGLRFSLRGRSDIRRGDLVEVVGFPDLSGPSPVLREALARRIGRASLPEPLPLPATNLLGRRFDAMLVRVDAHLANLSFNRADQVLELQSGGRGFIARLDVRRGRLDDLAVGSQLELQGVYAGQGGDVTSGRDIDSFELLLNSPADVRVLQRPSWWTGRHALTVLGAMSLIILVSLIWITQLRRQVEERSQLLATEVRRHEQTERQRALEQERARISRDLHDDLGASLTQIRLLSALESRDAQLPPTSRSRMSQVTEKSRQMVASLDEIVWAVNPANDSLPSLATYLCQFAEEFLRPTAIRCRLDVPDSLPHLPLTSEVRHNLYLAVREALNNIAKHSEATEVWLRIQCQDHTIRIGLEDNGRGFSFPAEAFAGDGLGNMRSRLERIGGHFECQTQNGAGTVCRIWMPLNATANGSSALHSV
jgi:signal transduction histidine kinase